MASKRYRALTTLEWPIDNPAHDPEEFRDGEYVEPPVIQRRVSPGEAVDDIPADSVADFLEYGSIEEA